MILLQLAVALVSLLAIVGSGSFAAKMLLGKKARWLGTVVAIAGYWLTFSILESALAPREGAETVGGILFAWAVGVVAGLAAAVAVSLGLRKLLPGSAPG